MKMLILSLAVLGSLHSQSSAQDGAAKGWGQAMWVWDEAQANQVTQTDAPRYLRLNFDLAAKFEAAELWITVDNVYTVYVNGTKVGQDPEWSTVEKYDVARHLVQGKNVLAILAQNQGGVAGAIARLHVRTADKKDLFVVTDQRSKITQNAPKGWFSVNFDDSAWFSAVVLGDAGIAPWNLTGGGKAAKGKKTTGPGGYGTNAVDPKVRDRLSAAEQKKHFVIPDGFEVELVAAEPLIINPITMAMDEKGRLYVSESHTYRYGPSKSPVKPFANPVIRLDPTADGGLKRTLVADGFADPVMGIAVMGDKLWLTANNYLYQYDLPAEDGKPQAGGIALNKKTILIDKNKAWNPFGMFVLEFGPDGLLYMSVGDHIIDIHGPDGKIGGRKNSGIIMRMNTDGTKLERLTHGFRVPYSYEYDPFGQLWLCSNGEGNPDRFVRVIEGVDYHCYSRPGIGNDWLAGNSPLAPPCQELHRGAHTQLMRYYGANFPEEYQGNLFLDNWGAHGFAGPNRGIFRFVLDENNNVLKKEPLFSCTDPHFRPSHILLDVDGSLLIADWYEKDDESDLTGRIWRLKYVGKNAPPPVAKAPFGRLTVDDLGSPHHRIREEAVRQLLLAGTAKEIAELKNYAATAKSPVGAANALWVLLRVGAVESVEAGAQHPDWKVRRLAVNILRSHKGKNAGEVARKLMQDKVAAVRIAAALSLPTSDDIRAGLIEVLMSGAAGDQHLRYEAAWHLAKHADAETFSKLLTSDDADIRLAGLIALDVACFEDFPTRKFAQIAMGKVLGNTGKLDQALLLTVAQLDGDATIVPGLEKLIARADVPLSTTAKAILVLKAKAGGLSKGLSAAAGKRLIEAVEQGAVKIVTPADHLMLFEFLESEGPTPFALKQIGGQLRTKDLAVRQAAHILARKFGAKSAPLAEQLWPVVLAPTSKFDDAIEMLSTVARIEGQPRKESWEKLLLHADPLVRTEAVRWWRNFRGNSEMVDLLVRHAPELLKKDVRLEGDLVSVLTHLGKEDLVKAMKLPDAMKDKAALTKYALDALASMPAAEKPLRAALGLQVFERNACTKCHTTATQTTLLAPSLKGIAAQKVEYLIESVIFPSKIIKTGFDTEVVVLKSGKVLTGLVKEEGDALRVLNLDFETRIARNEVESRMLSRTSIMPEGQELLMSRREFVDLIAYLATLK